MECIPRKNEVNSYEAHFGLRMGTPRKQKGYFLESMWEFHGK